MDIKLSPLDFLDGMIVIPASKSYSQRALAISLLVESMTIYGVGDSEDELAAIEILKACSISIAKFDGGIRILNGFDFKSNVRIDCNESGLSARLFSILLGLNNGLTTVRGKNTLLHRDQKPIGEFYKKIGGDYVSNENKLPLSLKGNRFEGDLEFDGSNGSQYISGILYYMVGLRSNRILNLSINNPKSIPYIDMTIDCLNKVGAKVRWIDKCSIEISPSRLYSEFEFKIEGDWSSASFWIVAAAINGKIILKNLNIRSLQADRDIIRLINLVGAQIKINDDEICIEHRELNQFEFDATHCPDLIPVLSVLALFCNGISKIKGVHRLINKESNRLNSILLELTKVSSGLSCSDDILTIDSSKTRFDMEHLEFDSHHDHRIGMSLSILAINLKHESNVKGLDCIRKSYPNFLEDLNKISKKR